MEAERTQIQQACDAVGGQAAMAAQLGISPAQVNQWCKGSRPVPLEYCVAIERATNGAVTRQDLRPDDWAAIWPELAALKTSKPAKRSKVTPSTRSAEEAAEAGSA